MSNEDKQDGEIKTPANINPTNNTTRFPDLTLPDNSNHEAVIAVNYKRYVLIFGTLIFGTIGSLFAFGVISFEYTTLLTTYGSFLIIPLLILFWLYEETANN